MKLFRTLAIVSLLLGEFAASHARCTMANTAFQSGEYLSYNLYFNWKFVWVKVGSATMSVVQTRYNNQPAYRGSLITRSNSKADKLFVLRDTLQAYTSLNLVPQYYRKAANEGGRYYVDEVFYSYPNGRVHVKQHQVSSKGVHQWKQHDVKDCVYDMLNIFLRARSFDSSKWKKGHAYGFTMVDGEMSSPALLQFQGKTTVKADNGIKYRCLQLSYMERKDGKNKRIVDFYVTDDTNHVPIRLDMFLRFGSAKAFLVGMKGVRNNMDSQVGGSIN